MVLPGMGMKSASKSVPKQTNCLYDMKRNAIPFRLLSSVLIVVAALAGGKPAEAEVDADTGNVAVADLSHDTRPGINAAGQIMYVGLSHRPPDFETFPEAPAPSATPKIGAIVSIPPEQVDLFTVLLTLDGNFVSTTIQPHDSGMEISYLAIDSLEEGSEHQVALSFTDTMGQTHETAWNFEIGTNLEDDLRIVNVAVEEGQLAFEWVGGEPPFLVQTRSDLVESRWSDLLETVERGISVPITGKSAFVRLALAGALPEEAVFHGELGGELFGNDSSGFAQFNQAGDVFELQISYAGLPEVPATAFLNIESEASGSLLTRILLHELIPGGEDVSGQLQGKIRLGAEQKEALLKESVSFTIGTQDQPNGVLTGQIMPVVNILLQEHPGTLVNGEPRPITFIADPPVAGYSIPIEAYRVCPDTGVQSASTASVRFLDPNGEFVETLTTNAEGVASGEIVAGFAGQGFVALSADGDTVTEAPIAVTNPNHSSCIVCETVLDECCGDFQDSSAGLVHPYSGEAIYAATPLRIPGRGLSYRFTTVYRGSAEPLGEVAHDDFGAGWTINYSSDFLVPDGENIIHFQDTLRTDTFLATGEPGVWKAPMENYVQLQPKGEEDFELRQADGTVKTYAGFNHPEIPGRLTRIEDRNGNFMTFHYKLADDRYVLDTVVDTMGRNIVYRYWKADETANPAAIGHLKEVEDFRRDGSSSGRKLGFDYDTEGNLVYIHSPAVTGTPTGNDFPNGKTTGYRYIREVDLPASIQGYDRQRLLHNLVGVTYPNETALEFDPDNPQTLPAPPAGDPERLAFTYGMDPADRDTFDRVIHTRIGGMNANGIAAGGTINYEYEVINPNAGDVNTAYMRTTVTDRRGNVTEYLNSPFETLIEKRELPTGLRNGEPAAYVTAHTYNHDKELIETVHPMGNRTEFVHDVDNPDRFQQGNLIATIRFRDDRGGDQESIRTERVYEPVFNRVALSVDPRGADPSFMPPFADPTGRTPRERYAARYFFDYQEAPANQVLPLLASELGLPQDEVQARLDSAGIELGLGDLNGDEESPLRIAGNVIRVEQPAVTLLEGSHQAAMEGDRIQEIVTLARFNQFGQKISETDPEGNTDEYAYFPESDPDGDGIVVAVPGDARTLNDSTGGYLSEIRRDTTTDPRRNNGTDPPPANIRETRTYDDVGNITSRTDGRNIRTLYAVNELNQVVQTTRAAAVPSPGSGDPEEPRELTAFSYIENTYYDFNNNVVRREIEDRGDTSNTGGLVDSIYVYDMLDNLVAKTEEVSRDETLVTRTRYDANENRTLVLKPEGNATTWAYDERDLLFQSTRGATEATAETLNPPAGPYDPRGGRPSTITYNYDPNENRVEAVDAEDTDGSTANNSTIAGTGDVTTYRYDGFDRKVRTIDAIGNETIVAYDPASNVVERRVRGPIGGPSPTDNAGADNVDLSLVRYIHDELDRVVQTDRDLFVSDGVATQRTPDIADGSLTLGDDWVTQRIEYDRNSRATYRIDDDEDIRVTFYDGVDRVIRRIDPEGNTVENAYDDNNNLIETKETDVSQVAGVADEIFLTTKFYDALDRLVMRVENTVDFIGQTTRFRYDSRGNLVAVSDSKGLLSGEEIVRRVFSDATVDLNDPGNVTLVSYDGINRRTMDQQVLTEIDPFFGAEGSGHPGADEFGVKAPVSVHNPDPGQGGGDGLITTLYVWDGNSLLNHLIDDNGNQTNYAYDNLDRRVTETKGIVVAPALADRDDPDTTITHIYDRDDNVVQRIDENGSVVDCSYDAINRRTACNIDRAPGVIGTTEQTFEYDGLSRLRLATDNNEPEDSDDDSTITFAYDSLSRTVEETQQIGALPPKAISSGWRAEDLKVSFTYPNDRIVDATYDALDRLDTMRDRGAAEDIVDYNYIGKGRVLERLYPINNTRLTFLDDTGTSDVGYDALRRPIRLRHVRNDNSLIVGFTHNYDLMNNKRREEKLHDPDNSEVYRYDSSYRLVDFRRGTLDAFRSGIETPSPDSLQQQTWNFDGLGNWNQTATTTGGNTDTESRDHSSFNELIARDSTALPHDDNGNQVSDGTAEYQWDYRNRLYRVTRSFDSQVVAEYAYDAIGRRTRKVVSNGGLDNDPALNGIIDFYFNGWQVCEEHHSNDGLIQQYVYGIYIDEPLVMDRNADAGNTPIAPGDERFFYHQNTLLSTYALTDMTGEAVIGYQFDAYGLPVIYSPGLNGRIDFGGDDDLMIAANKNHSNPYLFSGRRYDPESQADNSPGLYYYRHRYFNPSLGVFLSRDPLQYADGMNLYQYALSSPVGATDPFGLSCCANERVSVWVEHTIYEDWYHGMTTRWWREGRSEDPTYVQSRARLEVYLDPVEKDGICTYNRTRGLKTKQEGDEAPTDVQMTDPIQYFKSCEDSAEAATGTQHQGDCVVCVEFVWEVDMVEELDYLKDLTFKAGISVDGSYGTSAGVEYAVKPFDGERNLGKFQLAGRVCADGKVYADVEDVVSGTSDWTYSHWSHLSLMRWNYRYRAETEWGRGE